MNLTQLFSVYPQFKMGANAFTEISAITFDSREAAPDKVFVAINGLRNDGHEFLEHVCKKQIAGVVVESDLNVPKNYTGAVLKVSNTREAMGVLATRFYGEPAKTMFCVGVTGTNGKTSTTYMIEAVLERFGLPTGVVGTVDHHFQHSKWPTTFTSPDIVTLNKRLQEFSTLGAKALAVEVTSQALDQDRFANIPFDVVVFTNLTRDHLDYHGTMENYFHTKERLFQSQLEPSLKLGKRVHAIINVSDDWGPKIQVAGHVQRFTYGEMRSDFQFQILSQSFVGTRFRLTTSRGVIECECPMPGRHNVYNAVAAIATGVAAGASLETCVEAIRDFKGVPGRMQRVESDSSIHVFVDYAHTDDGLISTLSALEAIRTQSKSKNRIITVFGCGGDRDGGKRPMMANAAIEGSDLVFVTSDNPRTEKPMKIINEILAGVPKELLNSKVFVEVDRSESIAKAIRHAKSGDVILIAGKGHENYQIIGDRRVHLDDAEIAKDILSMKRN